MPDLLNKVHVDLVAPYRVAEPAVESSLRNLLLRRGAEIAKNPGEDVTLVRLSDFEEVRQVLSVGGDGKALEFQLISRVSFEVRRDDQILLPKDTLTVTRDYSFNAEEILAKEAEEERLREFLGNELAELLVLRIEAAARAVPPAPPADAAPAVPVVPGG